MKTARTHEPEVYDFLRSASARYGIGFWGPGAGIIHQVVLENYAFPGGMMIGTDSHTPNAGGLGMFACGVGGADAVDVMAGFPWEVLHPKLVGVHLTGQLYGLDRAEGRDPQGVRDPDREGRHEPRDRVLRPRHARRSAAPARARSRTWAPSSAPRPRSSRTTSAWRRYLKATGREELADLADRHAELLRADPEVEANPEQFFDAVVEIDLSTLEPHIVGPHTPDLARPVSRMARDVAREGLPGSSSPRR